MAAHCTKARQRCGALITCCGQMLIWLNLVLLSVSATGGEGVMKINCTSPKGQVDADYTASLIQPVAEKHGFELLFTVGQGPTIIDELRRGELDGDCGRIEGFNEEAGLNLIRVEPAVRRVRFALWGFDAAFPLREVDPKHLRVGYLATTQIAPLLADQMGYTNIHKFTSMDALAQALLEGQVDVMLNYQALVSGYNLKADRKLYRLRHVVTFPVYIYLQSRFQNLVADLSHAISAKTKAKPYEPYPDKEIPPLADDVITFGCSVPKHSLAFSKLEEAYRRAFHAVGYDFRMFSLPRVRERVELFSGNIDGTCARGNVSPFSDHPSLLLVRVPITQITLKVYSRHPFRPVTDLRQLPEGKRIAFVRGTKLAELLLLRAPQLKHVGVVTPEIGVKMLAGERVDYFVGLPAVSDYILNSLNIKKMLYVVSELQPIPLHAFIHKRHITLQEPLEQYFKRVLEERQRKVVLPFLEETLDLEAEDNWLER